MRLGRDNYNESFYRLRVAVVTNSVGGEAHRAAVFCDWAASVPPAYFHRLLARGEFKSIDSVQRWCFSRDLGSMEKRGEIKRRYVSGKRGRRHAVYQVRLTKVGMRRLQEEQSKSSSYTHAKRKT